MVGGRAVGMEWQVDQICSLKVHPNHGRLSSRLGWLVGRLGLQGHRNDEARGFFSRGESEMSSNSRKLTAVLFSLMAAARHLTNRVVLV